MKRNTWFKRVTFWPLIISIATLALLCVGGIEQAFAAASAGGEGGGGGHASPVLPVLLGLMVILFLANVGADLAVRLHQPAVMGELLIGVIIGNLSLIGFRHFDYLKHDEILKVLSELGVILLLFEVGLESNIAEMKKLGWSSLLVAVLGVIAPFFLGWFVGSVFEPDMGTLVHVFIGATLTATSVGITARVLKDLGKIQAAESKIVLGAAVIDDVLGLIVLAVVSGIITAASKGTELDILSVVKVMVLAVGFLFGAIFIGRIMAPYYFRLATTLRSHGVFLATGLIVCFGLSYLAALVGLAPIVGAFTAGLILDPMHYKPLSIKHDNLSMERIIQPIIALLVPIFFVTMGAGVDLRVFADAKILGYAFVLTLAAIVGKQVCGLGVLEKGLDRLVVGFGMIPRGEVGLIFIGIGATMMLNGKTVVDKATYGAVVIMVIVTTMIAPPLVKWRFSRSEKKESHVESFSQRREVVN
ncbi:MAG: cation:proton antiporter [Deltaproteobacteria bacterium]|nr:cation:proton antiporter [Deltaproteobacteria bacterium]